MQTSLLAYSGESAARHCRLAQMHDRDYVLFSEFIASVFRRAYDAQVMVSYPTLIGITGADGLPQAALGVRGASEDALFLERYLDQPAEKAVAERIGTILPRSRIAEAGNLASIRLAALRDAMFALSLTLKQHGFEYILFTGTHSLKRYLEALGLHPAIYAGADPARLGEEAKYWGRYYEMAPTVMGGSVDAFYYGLLAAYAKAEQP